MAFFYFFQIFFKNKLPSSIKTGQFFRFKIADSRLITSGFIKLSPQIFKPIIENYPVS